jgi:P27 family predicted phage terminase small subunit
MRGPKPDPTVLKLIKGNPGRRPLNLDEAKPPVVIPEPPELLKGEALEEWQRITLLLADVGLIARLDRTVIAGYCKAWERWVECERMLETTGIIVRSPNGHPIYSPYLPAANKALDQLRQLADQIGLSGSARSRIRAGEPAIPADAAEAFLSARA